MATYSNIGIKLITTGDESGTWGDTTNTNFSDILDEAIAGAVTYNISSDADVTLTVSDGSSSDARHAVINFTSTTLSATRTVTFAPDTLQKTWLVINSTTGGQSLTFKQGSAGSTVTVPNGESAWIYSDGAGATNGAITKALDSFTNTKITTGTLNATTLDLTNLEVTNVKAKDGTAAITIADSTGKVTVSSELAVDNLNLSGNAITSTNTNGNIDLTPDGTGEVNITKVDIDAGAIDGTTIGGASAAAGTFTTLTATTLGGALDANNQAITNINVDSGAIDGTPIGANSAATGAFTTVTATTGNITTVNATTVDSTNVEVTAIKAKDGTAAVTIADATGVVTIGSSVLTTADINGGTIDGTTIGGASAAAGTFTSLNSSSASTFNGGVVINELGADADTRIEGDTDANLFFVDASADAVGIGTNTPTGKVQITGASASRYLTLNAPTDGGYITFEAGGTAFADVGSEKGLTALGSATNFVLAARSTNNILFSTNNAERMRITSGGDVIIGNGDTSATPANGLLRGTNGSGTNITGATLTIQGGRGTGSGAGGPIVFSTSAAGASGTTLRTATERMRIDSAGRVGIGTTSPLMGLHLAKSAANAVYGGLDGNVNQFILRGNLYYDLSNARAQPIANGFQTEISLDNSDGTLRFSTSSSSNNVGDASTISERMRINSVGTLSIGTTASGFNGGGLPLIVGSGSGNKGLTIYSGSTGFGTIQFADTETTGADSYRGVVSYKHGDEYMYFSTNATEKMRIDSSGNVGIGTTSPEGKLHVLSASAGTVTAPASFPLVLEGSTVSGISLLTTNAGEGRIWFGDPDDNDVGRIEYAHSTNAMTFRTNASDRMVITSAGNVGIGTTSPSVLLETSGTTLPIFNATAVNQKVSIRETTDGNSNAGLRIEKRHSTLHPANHWYGDIAFRGWDGSAFRVGALIEAVAEGTPAASNMPGNLRFSTNSGSTSATERMRIDSAGNVGIGTTSPASALQVLRASANPTVNITRTTSSATTLGEALYLRLNDAFGAGGMRTEIGMGYGVPGTGVYTPALIGYVQTVSSANTFGDLYFATRSVNTDTAPTERMRITSAGNVKIGGTANRATTEGTNQLVLFNGTAPVGTLANGVSFYSEAGEARVMDAAGNSTLLSPHDQATNEWIFHSKHTPTGKVLRIDVERLLKFVNDHFGLDAVHEFIED